MPQTRQPISAASGPKFAILWGHVEEILLFMAALWDRAGHYIFALWFPFNKFLRLSIRALIAKIQPDKVVR